MDIDSRQEDFLETISICIFAGASEKCNQKFISLAKKVGHLLGINGAKLIYGAGSTGIMGAVSRSALAAGGHVVGVLPAFMRECDYILNDVSELLVEKNMHHRKQKMYDLADVFLALPGGIGTLDEIIEVLVWSDLGLHTKPIVLFNLDNYWQPLIELLEHIIAHGFVKPQVMSLLRLVTSYEELIEMLALIHHTNVAKQNILESQESILDNASTQTLTSFSRALLLQELAAKAGFSWQNLQDAIAKVQEELLELIADDKAGSQDNINAEYGDLLFAVINLARYLKVDLEAIIENANEKFINRFKKMEKQVLKNKPSASLSEMLACWNTIKTCRLDKDSQDKDEA